MSLTADETLSARQPDATGPLPTGARRVQMTEREFYQLPEGRVEFVDGEAHFMSPVSWLHVNVSLWLSEYARRLCRKHNAGLVFAEAFAVRLSPGCTRLPDLAFVSTGNDRVALHPNHLEGPPDLVVEIVSTESRHRDYHEKLLDYQAAGVTEYWIIDPTYRTVDLYRLESGEYRLISPTEPDPALALTSAVLPGFTLKAEWLKQSPLPNPDGLI